MRADIRGIDYTLKKMLFSPGISAKVQGGSARLVIAPLSPQPMIDHQQLLDAGLIPGDSAGLMGAVRLAFNMGLMRDIAPIQTGQAFELLQDIPSQKTRRFGSGIVRKMDIARLWDLSETHWLACGHQTQTLFLDYWDSVFPEAPAESNPWCWLIHFEYKEGYS